MVEMIGFDFQKSGEHKFKVLKSSPYQWKIFHYDGVIENKDGSSEIDMVPPSNPDQDYNASKTWNEGWKDKAKWLKFEYYNLREYETDKQLENRMAKLNLKKLIKDLDVYVHGLLLKIFEQIQILVI